MDKVMVVIIAIGILAGQMIQVRLGGLDAPVLDLAVGVAAVFGAYYLITSGRWRDIVKLPIAKIFGVLVGVLLLSLLVNISQLTILELLISGLFWVRFVAYGLLVFIVFTGLKGSPWQLGSWLLWIYTGVAVLGFLQIGLFPNFEFFEYLGWDPHNFRLLATWLDPNFVGIFLAPGVGLGLLMYFRSPQHSSRSAILIATIIIITALFLTFSRSALLALVVVLIIVTFILHRRLFVVGLGILVLTVAFSPRLQERLSGVWQLDVTVRHRIESWSDGLAIVRAKPILGVGYNTLPFTRYDYVSSNTEKLVERAESGFDSSLLTIAATSGLLGLLAWLWFVGASLQVAWRRMRDRQSIFSPLFVASTLALFLASVFVNAWLYPPILILWLVTLGLSLKEESAL